jgi:polyphosphate kinase 1
VQLYGGNPVYPDGNFDYTYMQNRELSWLEFNKRVLEEAHDESVPLFERLKFISIFTSNLDEFFMIRVGSLTDLSLVESDHVDNKTGMNPKQQLDKIFEKVSPIYKMRDSIFADLEKKLREFGICNLNMSELDKQDKKFIDRCYKETIMPILSPQVIDSFHPFPHLVNKALYIICSFAGESSKFGLIPISHPLPEFILFPGNQTRYILMENIVLHYINDIYSMYKIEYATIISVTRNADISPEEEVDEFDDDFRNRMKKVLKKRSRLSPVRLEVYNHISKSLAGVLSAKLKITKEQIFISNSPLVIHYPFTLLNKLSPQIKKQLSYPAFEPLFPISLNKNEAIISQCKKKDILLFFPYHQIDPFINLLKEASIHPNVISIKITIYRLASNSKIIEYLCDAAENGKEVTVLMELKARFDEKNNIEWAEQLENAGCNVIYGFEGYKVHSKLCLITFYEKNKITHITQIGTGNYNEKTAALYSDFSLITANSEIGQAATEFFKNMSISNLFGQYNHLLVAPNSLKRYLLALIDHEIDKANRGEEARIIIKSNSLTEKDFIQKLSQASEAGVEVQLIIRGICCLLPGIPGKTENITVRSIVGRFLEHSRIYCFGKDRDTQIYISSADLMTRNTTRRVEIACPILDTALKNYILQILQVYLHDNVKARLLQRNGSYQKIETPVSEEKSFETLDSQLHFIEMVRSEAGNATKPKFFLGNILSSMMRKK